MGGHVPAASWTKIGFPDLRVFPLILLALALDWGQLRHKDETFFTRWSTLAKASILAALIFVLLLLSFTEIGAPFVYQGF